MTTDYDEMERTWGLAATHSEYHVNDCIRYIVEGETRTGTIIWACAPVTREGQHLPTRYVVQLGHCEGSLDIAWSGNIVVDKKDEMRRQELSSNVTSTFSEQALIDMLASLSLPVVIHAETDDDGQRF